MQYATIDGLRIGYVHAGAGTKGQRVLYVHGTGCHSGVFTHHLEALAGRHEVAAIDLPGHGQSDGDGFRGVADYAFFVGGLIEALGWSDCVVAGHSLGGGIALATALYFPSRVCALLLVDTGARLRVDPVILESARRAAAGEDIGATDPQRGFARATPDAVIASVNALTAECRPEVTWRDWIADDSCDLMARLPGIRVPALAICGDEDEFTPVKYHAYFRDHLPDCRLEVVAGAGHWPFAEQPDVFDEKVLAFLDGLGSR